MAKVRIVTDTSARMPNPALWDHPLLTAAPMSLRAAGLSRREDPRRPSSDYLELFANSTIPVAEPPSVERMAAIYGQLFHESDQIISLHTAPAVNRCLANARAASDRYKGRCDIQVVNTQSISAGLGLIVQRAVEAADQGLDMDAVLHRIRGMIPRQYVVFFLDDLMYLDRHGLITRSQAILGNMLGVIAFLTMEDGRLIPMEKVRSRPRALEKLVEFVAEFTELEHISLLQPTDRRTDDSDWIVERLRSLHPAAPLTVSDYGPSVGSLIGPNSLGVIVLESEGELL